MKGNSRCCLPVVVVAVVKRQPDGACLLVFALQSQTLVGLPPEEAYVGIGAVCFGAARAGILARVARNSAPHRSSGSSTLADLPAHPRKWHEHKILTAVISSCRQTHCSCPVPSSPGARRYSLGTAGWRPAARCSPPRSRPAYGMAAALSDGDAIDTAICTAGNPGSDLPSPCILHDRILSAMAAAAHLVQPRAVGVELFVVLHECRKGVRVCLRQVFDC